MEHASTFTEALIRSFSMVRREASARRFAAPRQPHCRVCQQSHCVCVHTFGSLDSLVYCVCVFVQIMASEIGDETFIIAAILAMRHKKRVVFAGAISALALMTIISAVLGYVVPNLISKETTHNAATLLYTIFGLRLLYIGWQCKEDTTKEEFREMNRKLSPIQGNGVLRRRGRKTNLCEGIPFVRLTPSSFLCAYLSLCRRESLG